MHRTYEVVGRKEKKCSFPFHRGHGQRKRILLYPPILYPFSSVSSCLKFIFLIIKRENSVSFFNFLPVKKLYNKKTITG
jgi:hypothetical protein